MCFFLLVAQVMIEKLGLVYGNESAPIEIINYTSFQCIDCATMHERLHESIKRFIEDGTIRLIEKPIDITRFEYDEVIYKHMSEEQYIRFWKIIRNIHNFKGNGEILNLIERGN